MSARLFLATIILGGFLVVFAFIQYLKPYENTTAMPQKKLPEKVLNSQVATPSLQPIPAKTQQEQQVVQWSIKDRDLIYAEFGQLSFEMIEGRKPNFRQLSELLQQHQVLVDAKVIRLQDAINYLEFLKQVFPEIDTEIQFYIDRCIKARKA